MDVSIRRPGARARHGRRFRLTAVCLGVSGLLAACGGGGTTGPLQQASPPGDDGYVTNAYVSPHRLTLQTDSTGAPAGKVRVGVVDTGFLVNHVELQGQIIGAQEFAGTGTLADDKKVHGTPVAMVLAGRYIGHTGNAALLVAKVADANGALGVNAASQGAQWALGQGARVLNLSIGPLYRHYGGATDAWYAAAVQRDAAVVLAAGNDAGNLTAQTAAVADIFDAGYQAYRNLSLVVGALSGQQRASYSNYPGESAVLQSRFLVADGVQPIQARDATAPATDSSGLSWFGGTSVATPVVSAAATTLLAYWPHLSASATTQLLLDTADRSFSPLYGLNNCGSGGQTNCGYYTFGQGRLDLTRALQPVGPATVPAGGQLAGASYTLDATQLLLPAAFGDALAGRQLGAALFDSYGRDFGFNLLQRVAVGGGASLLRSGLLEAGDHSPPAIDGGRWQARLTRTTGAREPGPQAPLRLASLAGSGPLARYGPVHALDGQAWLGPQTALRWRSTHARGAASGAGTPTPTAVRQEMGLQWRLSGGGRLAASHAVTQERHALLGGTGSAGLGIAQAWQQAVSVQGEYPLPGGLALFGHAEWGWLQARGQGLMTRVEGGRTSQWAAGLAWARERGRWGLALSQPVRVDRARAHFDVPVGRTLEGSVLRQTERLDLAPAGRQLNLELAYQHQPDAQTQWGFNAVWARDFGHVQGRREWALLARYQTRW